MVEDDRTCAVSVSSSEPIHIQALQSSTRCGSHGQPWQLDAPPGQRITVGVLDFAPPPNPPPRPSSGTQGRRCTGRVYGFLVDRTQKTNASLCSDMTSPMTSSAAGALSDGDPVSLNHQLDDVLQFGSTALTTSSNSAQLFIVRDEHLANNFLVRVEGQQVSYNQAYCGYVYGGPKSLQAMIACTCSTVPQYVHNSAAALNSLSSHFFYNLL